MTQNALKSCPCCNFTKPEIEFIQTSEEFGSISICGHCATSLQSRIEDNRKRYEFDYTRKCQRADLKYNEKRKKREDKIFKRFMKSSYAPGNKDALGCLIYVIIIIIAFILYTLTNRI